MINNLLPEIKHIIRLAVPLFITQLIAALMMFTDTVIASRASHIDMAAVSIATGLWYPVIFTAQGLMISVTPVVAQLFGSSKTHTENNAEMVSTVYQGGYLAVIATIFIVGLYQLVDIPVAALNLEPELNEKTLGYLGYVIIGVLPTILFFALRGFCEGVGLTKPALVVSAIAVIANVPLNYIFVFGYFGMPELGGAGCGLATAIVQWLSFISLLIYFSVSKKLKPYQLFSHAQKPRWQSINNLIRIGTPIAFSVFFETTLFACMSLFIAPLGAIAVAGHQVAYSYSAVVFMAPLSLAMAATIRVGYLKGAQDWVQLRRCIKACFSLAVVFGTLVMLTTYTMKDHIIALYTDEPSVVALAASILVITAIYQLPDAFQVMSASIFKGLKVTKPLFYITFIAYWPIGFALGYVLGRTDYIVPAMGAQGFWAGVVVGLTCASLMFIVTLRKTMQRFPRH
ncbi:MAG: MATE family efflux transporter [Gammaproteobacteria bacterium]|nr:MATE family efflux transporter [Gammaproteobacteria bacterium]